MTYERLSDGVDGGDGMGAAMRAGHERGGKPDNDSERNSEAFHEQGLLVRMFS